MLFTDTWYLWLKWCFFRFYAPLSVIVHQIQHGIDKRAFMVFAGLAPVGNILRSATLRVRKVAWVIVGMKSNSCMGYFTIAVG